MPTAVTGYNQPQWITKVGPAGIIRQHSGLLVPVYNISTTLAIISGEPILHNGFPMVCAKLVLPSTMGEFYSNWIADFRLSAAHSGEIVAGDMIWWSYDTEPIQDNVGGAVASAPTNGFILGRAVASPDNPLNGSGKKLVATTGSQWVRVMSLQEPSPAIGTIPAFV